MAQRGGKRPGAGRPKGAKSRATKQHKATLEELAREYTPSALKTLVDIMKSSEATESARVTAANSILDRGYGKPAQAMVHTGPNNGPIETVDRTEREAALDRLAAVTGRAEEDAETVH